MTTCFTERVYCLSHERSQSCVFFCPVLPAQALCRSVQVIRLPGKGGCRKISAWGLEHLLEIVQKTRRAELFGAERAEESGEVSFSR